MYLGGVTVKLARVLVGWVTVSTCTPILMARIRMLASVSVWISCRTEGAQIKDAAVPTS